MLEKFIERLEIDKELHRLRREESLYLARKGLLNFTAYTKPDYEVNWHHRVLCKKLNDFVNGKIKRIMVFQPPRTGKSELVSRRLPAFILGKNPRARLIAASYSADLASQMNLDVQRIMDSSVYKELFPDTRLNTEETRKAEVGKWVRNTSLFEVVGYGGVYRSAGVGGGVTGTGADFIIVDDPIKNQEEADSQTYRDKLWDWWGSTLYTRLEKGAGICLTVTRWHEDDIAGRLLARAKSDPESDQWEVINFPAIREADENPLDPRAIGEPLWPAKYDLERLKIMRATVGPRVWSAIFQQRPAPETGNIIKREWFQFYGPNQKRKMPESFDQIIQSWDLTFTDTKTSDFVAGAILGKVGADIYLIDLLHDRLSFSESILAFQQMNRKHPLATAKYVERAANGFALVDTLKSKIQGIIPVKPEGSKVARVNAASPIIEAGNFFIPDPSWQAWSQNVIEEFAVFPNAKNDDIVDAVTQGLLKLKSKLDFTFLPVSLVGENRWRY